jgi:hypothetical protein
MDDSNLDADYYPNSRKREPLPFLEKDKKKPAKRKRKNDDDQRSSSIRRLVDERMRYEIFPNGHSQFLTKKALQELREGLEREAEGGTFEQVPESKSSAVKKTRSIPEPLERFGAGRDIVTLRLRAMKKGEKLPDLFEGDFVSGIFPEYASNDNDDEDANNSNTRTQFMKKSGFREFRILEIYWGYRALVQSLVGRQQTSSTTSGGKASVSDTNAFVICEVVVK